MQIHPWICEAWSEPVEDNVIMRNYPAVYTSNGADYPGEAQRQAIKWAQEQKRKNGGSILLYVPTRSSLQQESLIANFSKEKCVAVSTWRTSPRNWRGGPVIAAWPDEKHLELISKHPGVTALVVIPWIDNEIEKWITLDEPEALASGKDDQ